MENKIQLGEDTKITGAPAHLEGVCYGDRLVITNFPDTHKYGKYDKYLNGVRIYVEDLIQYNLANGSDELTVLNFSDLGPKSKETVVANGYPGKFGDCEVKIYADMVELFDKHEKPCEGSKRVVSIRVKDKDKDILAEMISKVDVDRIKKIMAISMGRGRKPSQDMVDWFMVEWAKHKYEYYLAFGRNLAISAPISFKIDDNEMSGSVMELYRKFPKYAATIDLVAQNGMHYFIDNKCPRVGLFDRYFTDFYKPGMNLSKFFSRLCQDPAFDLEFSKVLENREVKGSVVVSIDPYDYLTSAMTMHDWSSCHRFDGDMPGGVYSYAVDDATIVAYRDNGKVYHYDKGYCKGLAYDYGKNAFEGNSKSWRQMIYFDKDTCSMIFGREYPQKKIIDGVIDKVREIIEEAVANYAGIPNSWDNYGDLKDIASKKYFGDHAIYRDATLHHYSDIGEWTSLKRNYPEIRKTLISPANTDMSKAQIVVGGEMRCLMCGKKISDGSHYVLCGNCG